MRNSYLLPSITVLLCCWGGDACRSSPVDCVLSDWSEWSACVRSEVIEDGNCEFHHYKTRDVITEPEHGGKSCGKTMENITCKCPVSCSWGNWGEWSGCSSCGRSTRSRFRNVTQPALFSGELCTGAEYEVQHCYPNTTCPLIKCENNEFLCNDGVTCLSDSLKCNGDNDCHDFSDEPQTCEMSQNKCRYPDIPNIYIVGTGYDILHDRRKTASILDNSKFNGYCRRVVSGDHNRTYRRPANYQYYEFQGGARTSLTVTSFDSPQSFLQAEAKQAKIKLEDGFSISESSWSISAKVAFVKSKKFMKVIERSNSTHSKFFKIRSTVEVGRFRTVDKKHFLSTELLRRLHELPSDYDYARYSSIIQDYGTHFFSSGTLGGMFEYIYEYDKSWLAETGLNDKEQSDCVEGEIRAETVGESVGFGASRCSGKWNRQNRTVSFTRSGREVTWDVQGGTTDTAASLAFSNSHFPLKSDYDNWAATIKNNPAIIDFKLSPIFNVIEDHTKRDIMKEVFLEYLSAYDPDNCNGFCDNGGQFVVRGEGRYCVCVCSSGWSGVSCNLPKEPTSSSLSNE